MVIGAHHDDNELNAGTMAIHRLAGWSIVSVVATDGRFASSNVDESNIKMRESESLAAAKILGATCEFLRFREGSIPGDDSAWLLILDVIRKHRPRIVVTHPPRDYHLEHEQVSLLVQNAIMQCWNPTVDAAHDPCDRPHLYYTDAWFVPFEPDEYIDVTQHMLLKREALMCHRSQISPNTGNTMIDHEDARARYRGIEAGVRYAEAFRRAGLPYLPRRPVATGLASHASWIDSKNKT